MNDRIRREYEEHVKTKRRNGEEPQSYEDWLELEYSNLRESLTDAGEDKKFDSMDCDDLEWVSYVVFDALRNDPLPAVDDWQITGVKRGIDSPSFLYGITVTLKNQETEEEREFVIPVVRITEDEKYDE